MSKSKGKKKEVTTLGQPKQTKHIFIWTSEHKMAFGALENSFDHSTSVGVS